MLFWIGSWRLLESFGLVFFTTAVFTGCIIEWRQGADSMTALAAQASLAINTLSIGLYSYFRLSLTLADQLCRICENRLSDLTGQTWLFQLFCILSCFWVGFLAHLTILDPSLAWTLPPTAPPPRPHDVTRWIHSSKISSTLILALYSRRFHILNALLISILLERQGTARRAIWLAWAAARPPTSASLLSISWVDWVDWDDKRKNPEDDH